EPTRLLTSDLGRFILRLVRASFARALIVRRTSEPISPKSPPTTSSHVLVEPHNKQPPPDPSPAPPGGFDDPKMSVIGAAAASLAVRVGRAQLFSIMCRTENSS